MLKGFTSLWVLLCLVTSLNAQITRNDWHLDSENSRYLDPDEIPFFEVLPSSYRTATIDVAEKFKTIRVERQRIEIPNSNGAFDQYEIWPVEVVPIEMRNPESAYNFRGHKVSDPTEEIRFTIFKQAIYAAIYGRNGIEFISPASYENNISVIYNDKNTSKPYVQCGVDHDRLIQRGHDLHKARTDNMRTLDAAFSASGEYAQAFGGSPFSSATVINTITASINNFLNPILERDLHLTLTNVTTAAIIFEDPNSDPYLDINDADQLINQAQSTISSAMGGIDYDFGHLLVWENLGGLAGLGVVCDSNNKARAFSGFSENQYSLWVSYVAHELGHQLGMYHNHTTATECNTTDDFRFEPGDGSSIMSYAGLCGNSYQSTSDSYYHISSINEYNTYAFNCASVGPSITNPSVTPDVSTLTIPKSTPFVLVGSGNAAQYNWNQYDGSGPGIDSSPTGTCTDCANFRYAIPRIESYRNFPSIENSIANPGNDVTWEKLSSVPRTMNFKMVGRNSPGVSSAGVEVTVSNNGPLEITYPNGGEQLAEGSTIIATWNVNGTSAEASTVDILITTDEGSSFDLLIGDTANDGSETITLPSTITTNAYIIVQGHVSNSMFRGASTFYDISDGAFGIGANPNQPPPNDDYANAIEGFYEQELTGDIEFATTESNNVDIPCFPDDVNERDVWYKYTVVNTAADQPFNVQVDFIPSGNYGLEVRIPVGGGNISVNCAHFTDSYNFSTTLTGSGWAGTVIHVRVYERSSAIRGNQSNTRAPKQFTINTIGATALPIELVDFYGNREGRNVELSWTTASERNASHFDVLGSADGTTWTSIAQVKARGNSTEKIQYEAVDYETNNIYYKLLSEDLDGSQSISQVIYIPYEKLKTDFRLYPNPVDQLLTITIPDGIGQDGILALTNQQGQLVLSKNIKADGSQKIEMDVSFLNSGVYFLSFYGDRIWNQKVVIK